MKKVFITLSSIDDVKVFVNEINMLPCDADLVSGRYTVDAKSIMGIFSLDLSKPIELDIHCDDDTACEAFLQKIASFVTSK
ncbi:MAG: HPr family phosphocarrier protein [Clostridia bacterium]